MLLLPGLDPALEIRDCLFETENLSNELVLYPNNGDYTENVVGVRGRLSKHKAWWYNNLKLSKLIINVLEVGYEIPFVNEPPSCYLKNNATALNSSDFVIEAVTALIMQIV